MTTFGERLRAHRQAKGLTIYKLSQLTGISQPNISSIEKGRRPASRQVLETLSQVEPLAIGLEELRAWQVLDTLAALDTGLLKKTLLLLLQERPGIRRFLQGKLR